MVSTLVGLGGLYLFFKIVVPLILLALVVYFAFQWANGPRHEFSASEPDEFRADLDDDLRDDVRGPRI
ncbi:MAG: hypothetical protein JWM80_4680 [Cyanobacteria bacterium RYN_339]|nr:hypothetical protein [Cyanobacteria bacterium RYN_339]